MDDVELAIHQAWQRIGPVLLADQQELARRIGRRRRAGLRNPPRAWCLAVRASDARIPDEHRQRPAGGEPDCEEVRLDTELLRALCAPVKIDPPGQTLGEVAAKLGVGISSLLTARVRGIFRTHHVPGLGGVRGWPVPLLYTEALLDPSAPLFACADPVWSWTAPYLTNRIAADFEQTVTRVAHYRGHSGKHAYQEARHPEVDATPPPRRRGRRGEPLHVPRAGPDHVAYKWKGEQYIGYDWRAAETNPLIRENYERHQRRKAQYRASYYKRRAERGPPPSRSGGSIHFNGWLWRCPACGRTCRTIYCPLPRLNLLWDLPALARAVEIPRSDVEGFACGRCHRVGYLTSTTSYCWNMVISYLSGGLLYGREVARPAWFARAARKRAFAPRLNSRPSRRRPQVIELLLAGLRNGEIAERLGLRPHTIEIYVSQIYAQYGVHSRAGLAQRLRGEGSAAAANCAAPMAGAREASDTEASDTASAATAAGGGGGGDGRGARRRGDAARVSHGGGNLLGSPSCGKPSSSTVSGSRRG